jgi:MscS family membrane protein
VTRWLGQHPWTADVILSALMLVGSFLAARLLAVVLARVLHRVAQRTPSTLDDHMVAALKGPLAASIFLGGAYFAVHRLPLAERTLGRLDALLFVVGAVLLAVALVRSYGLLLEWYGRESKHAATSQVREFAPLFSKVGKGLIALLAAITVMQHFGVNVASLVVSLGVGSLAVGLAAQDTLANMFAGFTLMVDRPFRVNDTIQLAGGETGTVESIGVRATLIRTGDDTLLIVPNSALVKERLVNLSRPTRRQAARVELSVAYDTDLALARRLLAEAARGSALADPDREPVVNIVRFADLGVLLQLVFWVRDHADLAAARTEVQELALGRLHEAGVAIPSLPTARPAREEALQARS